MRPTRREQRAARRALLRQVLSVGAALLVATTNRDVRQRADQHARR